MLKLQEGHWHRGKSGKPRLLVLMDRGEHFYRQLGSSKERQCWISTFKSWAVEDLGTKEPKDSKETNRG